MPATPIAPLAYDEAGSGPPLLLIHAFPLHRAMWAPQMGELSRVTRCIAPDLRGFGESGGAPPRALDEHADDLVALLDALGVREPAVALGLSMGGYIALALWRRHSARVRALVLADTRAVADDEAGRAKRRALIASVREGGMAAVVEAQLAGLLGATTRAERPDVVERVRRLVLAARPDGVVAAAEAMLARPDSTPTLATIDVPTLVVVGEEDGSTTPNESRGMAAAVRGARLVTIPGAGHLSSLERPDEFGRAVRAFIGELGRG